MLLPLALLIALAVFPPIASALGLDFYIGFVRRVLVVALAGVLLACLAESITSAEVEQLAGGIVQWHQQLAPAGETTCVFRDSAFADDVAKTNMADRKSVV